MTNGDNTPDPADLPDGWAKIGGAPEEISDAELYRRRTAAERADEAAGDYSHLKLGDVEDMPEAELARAVEAQQATAAQIEFDAVVQGEFPDEPPITVV